MIGGGGDDTTTTTSAPVQEKQVENAPSELLNTISEGDGFQLKMESCKEFRFARIYVSAEFTNSGNLGIDGEVEL